MNVDTISSTGGAVQEQMKPAALVDAQRKNKEAVSAEPQTSVESPKIQPEELLDQIKSITQEGLYSVRFEKGDEVGDMVVKIFDNETQEVVRQIPAEELLNFKASFAEMVGNLVNTQG